MAAALAVGAPPGGEFCLLRFVQIKEKGRDLIPLAACKASDPIFRGERDFMIIPKSHRKAGAIVLGFYQGTKAPVAHN